MSPPPAPIGLRVEGRRGWEGRVKNGVRMKHMITLALIKFSYC